ncbi:hypothetical protein HOLleu_26639 [Holothuria leucospilota]|uniref:Uncharacterized protein n=1 Tax=Holothuria leucospilota TaxID=206669 RepID=A0A9Q1BPN1_HOLLE|nr:hypothetical protein HOLleu_26639 [Holothuria leucospilota]
MGNEPPNPPPPPQTPDGNPHPTPPEPPDPSPKGCSKWRDIPEPQECTHRDFLGPTIRHNERF